MQLFSCTVNIELTKNCWVVFHPSYLFWKAKENSPHIKFKFCMQIELRSPQNLGFLSLRGCLAASSFQVSIVWLTFRLLSPSDRTHLIFPRCLLQGPPHWLPLSVVKERVPPPQTGGLGWSWHFYAEGFGGPLVDLFSPNLSTTDLSLCCFPLSVQSEREWLPFSLQLEEWFAWIIPFLINGRGFAQGSC